MEDPILTSPPSRRSPQRRPFHIAILGAGIGGLALAVALQRHGISFTLYEAAPVFSTVGAGLSLGPNAVRAMEHMAPGFADRFTSVASHPTPGREYDMLEGMLSSEGFGSQPGGPFRWGNPPYKSLSVHRRELLDIMAEFFTSGPALGRRAVVKATSPKVRFGMRAVRVSQEDGTASTEPGKKKVAIEFEGGEVVEADAVVACDGIKGISRAAVLGQRYPDQVEARYTNKFVYRSIVPMAEAKEVLGRDSFGDEISMSARTFLGKKCFLVGYPISGGTEYNLVTFIDSVPWSYHDWTEPVSSEVLVKDMEGARVDKRLITLARRGANSPLRWALYDHPETPTYFDRRICLLGDSAHATLPHQAAGAGQCIEDALVLSELLRLVGSPAQLEAAFATYDGVRRPRAQRVVRTTREAGDIFALRGPGIGEDLARLAENMRRRHLWIWEHDLSADVERAKLDFLKLIGRV